jgi:23S rRNA pseudouridine1911/1915/1917 synthase
VQREAVAIERYLTHRGAWRQRQTGRRYEPGGRRRRAVEGQVRDPGDNARDAEDDQNAHDDDGNLERENLPRAERTLGRAVVFGGCRCHCRHYTIARMTVRPEIIRLDVPEEAAGDRLDRFLASRLPDLSRARIQSLIRSGQVRSGGGTLGDAAHRVKPGERLTVTLPPPEAAEPAPEERPLVVVYEDAHLLVIDKPAGVVVHPAPGHGSGTVVNALLAHCGASLSGIGGIKRPGIVHRLDRDTSGLLVVAKSDRAHRGLAAQFAAHGRDGRLSRAYLALVWGAPHSRTGRIEAAVGRKPSNRTRMAVVSAEHGRAAVTRYEVLETFRGAAEGHLSPRSRDPRISTPTARGEAAAASLVRCVLETGRTHQVRVHLAHLGHPILGDKTYGAGFAASARTLTAKAQAALAALDRQALHAAGLGFEHPVTGERLRFESEPPADMAALIAALR